MTEEELELLEGIEMDRKYPKFIVPCQWACQLVYKARKEGRIEQEVYTNGIINVNNTDMKQPLIIQFGSVLF